MAKKQPGRPLTAAYVKHAPPGRHGDGHGSRGLSLRVYPLSSGRMSRSWNQQLQIGGKATTLTLGKYPEVSLAEARQIAIRNSRKVHQGIDPRLPGIPTFSVLAESHIVRQAASWSNPRTAASWRSTLAAYAYPVLGQVRVDDVTTAHVLRVLEPIWLTKASTARKVLRRIGSVMQVAVAEGHRSDNPAGPHVLAALPAHNRKTTHRKAVPVDDAPDAYRRLSQVRVSDPVRLAAQVIALTGLRSAEVREARWSEIDREAALFTIPASRTKTRTEHRVPLTDAVETLLAASQGASPEYIFPGPTGLPVSGEAVRRVNSRVGSTTHGWRSTMRSWMAEAGIDRQVAETCLGHLAASKVEAAYQRSDLLDRRREALEAWNAYLI
ncbi:MAG: tyrosine-type recombinase/integrase [bacterium]|nr:tyrosine-type recombinase/integrase [bacterium]